MRNKSPGKYAFVSLLALWLAFAFLITSCHPAKTQSVASDTIVFEGVLQKLGPDPGIRSGRFAAYRLAKYRVEKVCSGKYEHKDIVVDHLMLTGKEFENVQIGDQLCVTADISREISVRNNVEGIRTQEEFIQTYYVGREGGRRTSAESPCCAP